jgi:hypothetical protein
MLDIGGEQGSLVLVKRLRAQKKSDPEKKTPNLIQALFRGDVIEVDPLNHISN